MRLGYRHFFSRLSVLFLSFTTIASCSHLFFKHISSKVSANCNVGNCNVAFKQNYVLFFALWWKFG